MKSTMKKLEDLFAAAAFAEAGEFETARQIMREKTEVRPTDRPSLRNAKRSTSRPTLHAD